VRGKFRALLHLTPVTNSVTKSVPFIVAIHKHCHCEFATLVQKRPFMIQSSAETIKS
jgi:hypothetical protein